MEDAHPKARFARGSRVRTLGPGAIAAAFALAVAFAATPAGADDIEAGLDEARWSFQKHAKGWMADLEKNEARNRSEAEVYSIANEPVIRFEGYGDDFQTQVKATGHAQTPYVGILRYKENLYTCLHEDQQRCTVTRSVPVSEIFSFRNGRWTY